MIVDHDPNETDVTVRSAAGVKAGFSHEEIDSRYPMQLSPDGNLVAYATADRESGDVTRVELFDIASESVVARLMLPPDAVLNGISVLLDTGALVNVFDREIGTQVMHFLSLTGVDPVIMAASISAFPSPHGTKVTIGARYRDDGTIEYQIWNAANRTLTDPTTVDIVSFNPVGWVSDELVVVLSADGAAVGLEAGNQAADLGTVDADVINGSILFRGDGSAYISTRGLETDTFSVVLASERTITSVVAEGYRIRPLATSADGRYLALSAFENSNLDEWLLYVYDFHGATLIEVDEGSGLNIPGSLDSTLRYVGLAGNKLVYNVQTSAGSDSVETRVFDLGSDGASEVLYKGAIVIVPTVGL